MSNDEFFEVVSPFEVISFRLSEIVAIYRPNRPHKPAGWLDGCEAEVCLRNRTERILLTKEQLEQLQERMTVNPTPPKWTTT